MTSLTAHNMSAETSMISLTAHNKSAETSMTSLTAHNKSAETSVTLTTHNRIHNRTTKKDKSKYRCRCTVT